MKEYTCERLYRDARVTTIYEGTTQMQVVAAIRYVTSGFYASMIDELDAVPVSDTLHSSHALLTALSRQYKDVVQQINETKNEAIIEALSRRMVEMAGYIIMAYLLLHDANRDESLFGKSAHVFVRWANAEVMKHVVYIQTYIHS